jgi:LPXTG-site transpeptidase (sortase) family protein
VGSRVDYARYNAVFFLLYRLTSGDTVEVVYKNRLYQYRVERREILEASDLRYLTRQEGEEQLVLSTCYPPGTTWKRLAVVAKREY